MSDSEIFTEGGETKLQRTALRQAFSDLFERTNLKGRKPRVTASGSRNSAFEDFQTAFNRGHLQFAGLLIDSEEPVADIENPWDHLKSRDNWDAPASATNENVFLMTTCTETWLVADAKNLRTVYGSNLIAKHLPSLVSIENSDRKDVHDRLVKAFNGKYKKGEMTFEILGSADPRILCDHLPSFARMISILDEKLT